MKFDEMLKKQKTLYERHRKRPDEEEHRLQKNCVRWFRYQYPALIERLFAVPNGGRRDAWTGQWLKEEGVLSGVSDLILLKPNRTYGALLIEMKTPKGRQSAKQQQWQSGITRDGEYKYVVCRSIEEFRAAVTDYINDKEQ